LKYNKTVSIVESLRNQQHMQTLSRLDLACNSGPVVYAYRLHFIIQTKTQCIWLPRQRVKSEPH